MIHKWAYGVTTTPHRLNDLLPATLISLAQAGFDRPWLFVDGGCDYLAYARFELPVTFRGHSPVRAYGHWVCSLWELLARNPAATMFALFQDDVEVCRNLLAYLDRCGCPDHYYLNPYCSVDNYRRLKNSSCGWLPTNQMGRGALALVFNRQGVVDLLQCSTIVQKAVDIQRGWRNIDGAVSHALVRKCHYKEFTHNPGLARHTGDRSVIGNRAHPASPNWAGPNYDPLPLLESPDYVRLDAG